MTDNHQQLTDAYKAIAEVLDRHGITYFAAFGTAIGAVRHSGIIPWDDDLDIAILAKDLDEVNRVLSEELDPERFYYHNPSADSHPHVVIRTDDFEETLRNREAAFIDIFILLDYPDSILRRGLMYPFIGFDLLPNKVLDSTESGVVKALFYGIMHVSRKLCRLFSTEKTSRYNIRAVEVRRYSWEKADFGTPVLHDFEDTVIPIPENYHKILTEFYGDYMTPPPEGQRSGATGYPYSLYNDYLEDQGRRKKHSRLSQDVLPR